MKIVTKSLKDGLRQRHKESNVGIFCTADRGISRKFMDIVVHY